MRLNITFFFRPIRRNTLTASVSYSLEEDFGSPGSPVSVDSAYGVHRCQWLRLTGFTGASGFVSPGSLVSVASSHRVHRCQWLRLTGFTGVSGFHDGLVLVFAGLQNKASVWESCV